MSAVTLRDPSSGRDVPIALAERAQACGACSRPVEPQEWIVAWVGKGWVHLEHLPRVLMSMTMSPESASRAAARAQLDGAKPGDRAIVSRELLDALGMGEER